MLTLHSAVPALNQYFYLGARAAAYKIAHHLAHQARKYSYQHNFQRLQIVEHAFNEQQAAEKFAIDSSKKFFADKEDALGKIAPASSQNPLRKAYLPFYGINAKIKKVRYEGQYGINHISTIRVKDKTYTTTHTTWHPIEGSLGPIQFSDESNGNRIYAGHSFDPSLIEEAIKGEGFKMRLRPLEEHKLDKAAFLDPFLKRSALGQEEAYRRIHTFVSHLVRDKIASRITCHEIKVGRTDYEFGAFELSTFYLPGYILQHPGAPPRVLSAIENNSQIIGSYPISLRKTIALAGSLSGLAALIGFPYASIAARLGIVALSCLGAGGWAHYNLRLKNYFQQKRINEQKERNQTVSETYADKKRREATEPSAKRKETNAQNASYERCMDIVGLKATVSVTERTINEAYHNKMKEIHPDHGGSEEQTKNLNLARQTLIGAIRQNRSQSGPIKRNYSTLAKILVKEPPRSIYNPRAKELIDLVLREQDYEKARMLVNSDSVHPDSHDDGENTLLAQAAKEGDAKAAIFALEQLNASPDTSCDCPDHRTPLHYAAEKGHLNVAICLLEHGANPNLINSFGETPLDIAIWKANDKMIAELTRFGAMQHNSIEGTDGTWLKIRSVFKYSSSQRTMLLGKPEKLDSGHSLLGGKEGRKD